MKLAILFMAMLSPFVGANECTIDSEYMQATYQVSNTQNAQPKVKTQQFILWRTPTEAAQQEEYLVEMWQQLKNDQIRPIRYFPSAQRGIEYQPSDVQGQQNFSSKYQLVSNELLAKMALQDEQGEGCDKVQRYRLKDADTIIELSWAVNKQLLQSMRIDKPEHTQVITLQAVKFDKKQVKEQFAIWDRYQTTDYADIGDNESDPFLANMIRLGFIEHSASGFYDANGHAITRAHNHH